MAIANKRSILTAVFVALLLLTAVLLRNLWEYIPPNDLRGLIYIGLFMAWGISVRRRIIQEQVCQYLMIISALMVFWMVVRTMKYSLFSDMHLGRYCWYLFYFPMLFIPPLVLLVALSLGKDEDFRLTKWGYVPIIVSMVLFLLVLSNDHHQLAFAFPKGLDFHNNNDYVYRIIYYISMAWMAFCAVTAFIVMILKCHVPGNKKRIWLPLAPMILLIVYAVLYVTALDFIKPIAGDMTSVCCLLITAGLESCIQCGLIQSNAHYWELFSAATNLTAQITDKDYIVCYASGDAPTLSLEQMREAEEGPVLLAKGKYLYNMPVNGGHAIWTEDVSELLALREKLKAIKEELGERNALLRYEYEQEKERKSIEEQNRLYNILQSTTQKQIDKISLLVREYHHSEDNKTILAKIAVLSSFVKRRKHLALLLYDSHSIAESDLTVAIQECINTLKLLEVQSSLNVDTGSAYLAGDTATRAYEFFEDVMDTAMDGLRSVMINISVVDHSLRISMRLFCSVDLTALQQTYPNAEIYKEDEDEWLLLLALSEGGERE